MYPVPVWELADTVQVSEGMAGGVSQVTGEVDMLANGLGLIDGADGGLEIIDGDNGGIVGGAKGGLIEGADVAVEKVI